MAGFNFFTLFKSVTGQELAALQEFVEEVSDDLTAKQKKLEKAFDTAKAQAVNEEEADELHSAFEDDANKYFKTFPVYTYNPILLSLYGLFENWLKELCDYDNRRGFSKITVSDLAGFNYIDKSKKYLNLISEVNLEPIEHLWKKITFYQKVRNCIAHNNSNIAKNRANIKGNELFNQLKSDKSISLDESSGTFYIKDKVFILEAIDTVSAYISFIADALSRSKVVAKNTTMPYDNSTWGEEKIENLLKDIIHGISLIKANEERTDEFRDSDVKHNLKGLFGSMAYDITKLYAFFCDGNWQPSHREIIINEENGLAKLRALYKDY